jgi:hypothetical protein
MERFVSPELHGMLDYLTVGLFIAGAKVFGADEAEAPAAVVPSKVFGLLICLTAPLTDYGADKPFGGWRVIPMKKHLAFDAMFGLAIGLAPWLSGSWRKGWNYWAPQTFAMTSEVFFALTTKTDTK